MLGRETSPEAEEERRGWGWEEMSEGGTLPAMWRPTLYDDWLLAHFPISPASAPDCAPTIPALLLTGGAITFDFCLTRSLTLL